MICADGLINDGCVLQARESRSLQRHWIEKLKEERERERFTCWPYIWKIMTSTSSLDLVGGSWFALSGDDGDYMNIKIGAGGCVWREQGSGISALVLSQNITRVRKQCSCEKMWWLTKSGNSEDLTDKALSDRVSTYGCWRYRVNTCM